MFLSPLETTENLWFPSIFSIYTYVQPLQIELSTNMSLEGTKEISTFPGNSCFSFVSGGDKGDSQKHDVFWEKKRLHILYERLTFRPRFCNSSSYQRNQLEKKDGGLYSTSFCTEFRCGSCGDSHLCWGCHTCKVRWKVIKISKTTRFKIYGMLYFLGGAFF